MHMRTHDGMCVEVLPEDAMSVASLSGVDRVELHGDEVLLVLIAATAYSAAAWKEQPTLQIVSAAVWLGSALLLFVLGDHLAWGMFALLGAASASLWVGFRQRNRQTQHPVAEGTRG